VTHKLWVMMMSLLERSLKYCDVMGQIYQIKLTQHFHLSFLLYSNSVNSLFLRHFQELIICNLQWVSSELMSSHKMVTFGHFWFDVYKRAISGIGIHSKWIRPSVILQSTKMCTWRSLLQKAQAISINLNQTRDLLPFIWVIWVVVSGGWDQNDDERVKEKCA